MNSLRARSDRIVVTVACMLLVAGSSAWSETTIPSQLRALAEERIVLGVDTSTTVPRLVVGDRFSKVPRALQARALAIASAHANKARANASELQVVHSTGRVIEKAVIRPR